MDAREGGGALLGEDENGRRACGDDAAVAGELGVQVLLVLLREADQQVWRVRGGVVHRRRGHALPAQVPVLRPMTAIFRYPISRTASNWSGAMQESAASDFRIGVCALSRATGRRLSVKGPLFGLTS